MINDTGAAALRSLSRRGSPAAATHGTTVPIRPYPWPTRVALPVAVILAIAVVAAWSARDLIRAATDVRVVPVVMLPAAEDPPPGRASGAPGQRPSGGVVVAQAAGWIEPDPYAVAVSALTDGVVREVLILEGQRVRAGDVVAHLVDDDARLAVRRAEAELAGRRAERAAAQANWDHPIDRDQAVAVSSAAAAEARAELDRLASDVAAEEARAEELADQFRRFEASAATGAASALELMGTKLRLEAQRAVVRAATGRRPVLEATLRRRQAEATGAAEGRRLRVEETRALAAAEAALQSAEVQLAEVTLRRERTAVRAPAGGVVLTRLAEPGGKLVLNADSPTSAHVARLYDPARLQVRVDVPLADAPKVGVGAPAEVLVEALPGRTLPGEVTRILHEADVAKNTLQFKVRIIDPPDGLKPEMLARVRFLAPPPPPATRPARAPGASAAAAAAAIGDHLPFVPERLVRREGAAGASFVLVADRGRGIATRRAVTLGRTRRGGWVAVTSGLAAGDAVVADPATVADGQRVRVTGEAPDPPDADAAPAAVAAKEGR